MKKLISVEEAVAKVKDGMTVMIGGFLSNGTPNAIVNALAQSEVKNLILIVNDTAYPDKGCGQLIANKQVKKVIVSHIGTNPCTSEQMNSGELEIEFSPQGKRCCQYTVCRADPFRWCRFGGSIDSDRYRNPGRRR